MKNKRIFFIADAKSIHTAKWVDYFVQNRYDVYLATFSTINNTKCNNIFFLYLLSIGKLSKIFKEINPDFINAHYSYSMGFIALLAKNRAKIKASFSVVCHGSDILDTPNRFIFDKLNKYILNSCDRVFVVSDQIKDKIDTFGVSSNKIFIGQYGIDLDNNENCTKDIDILSNRAYIPNSRIDFLLDSLDVFKDRDLNIIFVVAYISDKNFNNISKKYPHITFYKEIEYSKMMNLMSRAKIYISATKSDGTALSLLEAMKYKLIPIVSNIVSNRSWILDGINGYLFNNKRDFIQKLDKTLNMKKEDIDNISNNNLKLLKSRGDYNKQMKKIEIFLTKSI
ncbi:Glycosyltransferase [hydrothermal vent metagenome]|uniref:Glycosyltransferase n=1 Tax=hydrothermal vent metagenome TaxID=652676 RepID=A0A1W1EJT6_9ZZZZ